MTFLRTNSIRVPAEPRLALPLCQSCLDPHRIFVFGSNLAGIHGAGAAAHAMQKHNAIWGQGVGLQGASYALPTKDRQINSLSLDRVAFFAEEFIIFAEEHQRLRFFLTKVGCGLAGFTEEQIKPLFANAPRNVLLPEGWAYHPK